MASADVVAEIAAVRETVASWFDVDRSGWTSADRSTVMLALLDLQERTEAVTLTAAAEWNEHEAWAADGTFGAVARS